MFVANLNMTSHCDVPNSVYPVTMTTMGLRHCSILELGRGASNQVVAPGITRPLHAIDRTSLKKCLWKKLKWSDNPRLSIPKLKPLKFDCGPHTFLLKNIRPPYHDHATTKGPAYLLFSTPNILYGGLLHFDCGPLSVDHRLFMFYHFSVVASRHGESSNVLKHISNHNLREQKETKFSTNQYVIIIIKMQ